MDGEIMDSRPTKHVFGILDSKKRIGITNQQYTIIGYRSGHYFQLNYIIY